MYEQFFNLLHTPFERNIPCDKLYCTRAHDELQSRLINTAKTRKFCVVTGSVGVGKTTAIRKFADSLDQNLFRFVYISDSALTPRVFYWEVLKELSNIEKPSLYRSDGKHKMLSVLEAMLGNHQTPVIIIDEAHLLSHEMLEETRFLLNYKMDSRNPMALIIVGQNELRAKLSKEIYEPICQRIDCRFALPLFDRSQTQDYIAAHMNYAGETRQIFTDSAISAIYAFSAGCARKINKACTMSLLAASQQSSRSIDEPLVTNVIEQELHW